MLTNEQLSYICRELGLDPADPAIRHTIERLVEAKPNVPVDDRFIALLREDIQAKAAQTAASENKLIPNFMNKILASALVVMIALAAGGLWYIQNRTDQPLFQTQSSREAGQLLSGEYGVTEAAEESFGELDKVAIVNKAESGTGGGNAADSAMRAFSTDQAMSSKQKLIAPGEPYPITNYTFEYVGKDITGLQSRQSVLRRATPKQSTTLVERILGMLSFGLVDLNKFNDVIIQNFAFVEDKPNGYAVNVDMTYGSVSINLDWQRATQITQNKCLINVCPEMPPLTEKDIPANNIVFEATNKFLADYGISTQAYGSPIVQDSYWRIMYDALPADQKAGYYFPEQVQVVYPLLLEGEIVYDEGGQPNGLNLTYDIRTKRVVSLYELTTKKFERSSYAGVTDAQKIVEVAERGGFRNYTYPSTEPNVKNTVLQLDTPSVKWVKMWYSDPNMNTTTFPATGGELYVPSMVFPIRNWQQSGYWRSTIIVPLVQDILNSDYVPEPILMPVEPDGGNGSSGGGAGGASEPVVLPNVRN